MFRIRTTLVVLNMSDSLKRTSSKQSLIQKSYDILVALYVFDSQKKNRLESRLFGNWSTLLALYILVSLKRTRKNSWEIIAVITEFVIK